MMAWLRIMGKPALLAGAFLLAFCALLAAAPQARADDSYGLTLAGREVTAANAADIFGDGTASYDPVTNTLTLENFAATGNDAGGPMLQSALYELTIDLKGSNALVSGTNAIGIFTQVGCSVVFTGNGSLAVSGGYVPDGYGASGISVNGMLTFDPNFTGTVVATGGTAAIESSGIFCASGLTVRNGTVIANGGNAGTSMGINVSSGFAMDGGVLVAQGGNGLQASYGIMGYNTSPSSRFDGGVAVVRAGLVDGAVGATGRAAFSLTTPALSNTKTAAAVGYADGAFSDTGIELADATGVVIVPNGFTSVDDFFSLPQTLSADVCHVSTDGTNFGANGTQTEMSLDLGGHTALFVNLCESTEGSGSLVGVGGSVIDSYSVTDGINATVESRGASSVLGVGGIAGNDSWGIHGRVTASDSSGIMGVGGSCLQSEGIYDTATAQGGTVIGVGGYASKYSVGCNSGLVSYPGGKAVGLGGVVPEGSSNYSYGSWTSPVGSYAGDQVVAGRTRAYSIYDSASTYKFFACAEGATGLAYTDYAGTQGETAVDYDTTQGTIYGFKRVVIAGKPVEYPLYVAGVRVTSKNAADLTAIEGVNVGTGGHARYDAATNTLELKGATIENPPDMAEIIDPLVYTGGGTLAIRVEGTCELTGADGFNAANGSGDTRGIDFGFAALTITLVDDATLLVNPGTQTEDHFCYGIIGDGTLTVDGEGVLAVYVPAGAESLDDPGQTFAFNLRGDVVLAGATSTYGSFQGSSGSNTAGMLLRGPGATITVSDEAGMMLSGSCAAILVSTAGESDTFDLQFVAEEGWKPDGSCNLFCESASGHVLAMLDCEGATITHSYETCDIWGNPSASPTERKDLGRKKHTFAELESYVAIELLPAAYFTLGFGTTAGGSYSVYSGGDSHENLPGSINVMFPRDAEVTLVAKPASGYTFDGWYQGVWSGGFVGGHTNKVLSTSASYTFTPARGGLAFQAVFKKAEQTSIADATVTASAQTYTGKALTPAPVVKLGGKTLKAGTDYTVSGYKNNVNAGTATVTVAGKGSYTGTASGTFAIKPASIAKATVAKVADQAATGKAIEPAPKVTLGGKTLKKGTDYKLSYKNNVLAGTATITVTGKGNYTGTKAATFKIVAGGWKRIAGAQRMETAALVSQEAFAKGSCKWAVVANCRDFPDALAASGLAGARGGALILVDGVQASLNSEAKSELKRLGVKNVYIMGSEKSVSAGIAKEIKSMGISWTRLGGKDRVDTSVMALRAGLKAGSKADTVIVTTLMTYPDTLSISPWSYANAAPVVLTWTDGGLTDDAVKAVKEGKYKKAVIVSTDGAVGKKAETQLKSAGVKTVTWLTGKDAYATNAAVVSWELKNGMTAQYPVVATYAKGFADALGGSALAGSKKSVIVLADSASAPGVKLLVSNKAARVQGYVLGGEGTISAQLMSQIATATGGKVVKS